MPKSSSASRQPPTGPALTEREMEILRLVAGGQSTAEIAQRLAITEATVKTHLTKIYRKTGMRNRVQAARYYLANYGAAPGGPSHLLTHIRDIEARLEQLQPALQEAARLQRALSRLRAAAARELPAG
jgi:DNA-binding CsgD family transcriptional regulator